jgi:predicted P-loop ATPase/GTPase
MWVSASGIAGKTDYLLEINIVIYPRITAVLFSLKLYKRVKNSFFVQKHPYLVSMQDIVF